MLTGDDTFDNLTTVVAEVSNAHFRFAHSAQCITCETGREGGSCTLPVCLTRTQPPSRYRRSSPDCEWFQELKPICRGNAGVRPCIDFDEEGVDR